MSQDAHVGSDPRQRDDTIEVRSIRDLGAAIRRIRRERGYTQSDLAAWIGTNRFSIHRLETGEPVGLPLALNALAFLGRSILLAPRNSPPSVDREPDRG